MEISLDYSARDKADHRVLFEGVVTVRVSKQEAFEICKNYFIWQDPDCTNDVETVYARGLRKARSAIYKERALRRNEYELEIEFTDNQSDLFTDAFVKEFIKWVLKDAHNTGFTIYNDHGLCRFYEDTLRVFSEYYSGDLVVDARRIQDRIMRR